MGGWSHAGFFSVQEGCMAPVDRLLHGSCGETPGPAGGNQGDKDEKTSAQHWFRNQRTVPWACQRATCLVPQQPEPGRYKMPKMPGQDKGVWWCDGLHADGNVASLSLLCG